MVLNHYTLFSHTSLRLTFSALLLSLVSACSHLNSQPSTTNTSINPVIPVMEEPTKPELPREESEEEIETITHSQKPTTPSNAQLAPTDVLGSILNSAKKALKQQQWLRAQRHLEHALRVAPKHAEVYYIYSEVYEGLGVEEQVVNMLKRARFLSKPGSEIYQSSSEKIEQLDQ